MAAVVEYQGCRSLESDFDENMEILNEFIDIKLRGEGVDEIVGFRDKVAAIILNMFDLNDDEEEEYEDEQYDGKFLNIIEEGKSIIHDLSLNYLILCRAIIADFSVFDIAFIIDGLDIDVVEFINDLDEGIWFEINRNDGRLIDPLTLSIGAIQGAAVHPDKLEDIRNQAHHSYLLFNAFVGSGAAIGFLKDLIKHEKKFSPMRHELCDIVLGSLIYVTDKAHLPGGSFDRYFQTNRALDPLFVKHELPASNSWECLIAHANTDLVGSEFAREMIAHVFSDSFLINNEDKVRRLLHNLDCLADQEDEEHKGSYNILFDAANNGLILQTINLLNIKMNLLGYGVFSRIGSINDDAVYRPLVEDILSHGSSIVEQALRDALRIHPDDIGMSFLSLPNLARKAAGSIPQQVFPGIAVSYLKLGIAHYIRVSKHPEWDLRFSSFKSDFESGFSYLLNLPGVQETLATSFKKMSKAKQNIIVSLGMNIKHLRAPSHSVMGAMVSRDLGL